MSTDARSAHLRMLGIGFGWKRKTGEMQTILVPRGCILIRPRDYLCRHLDSFVCKLEDFRATSMSLLEGFVDDLFQ